MPDVPAKRRYVVVGGGAIGGTLALCLARVGHNVVVVDSDRVHVEAIRANGLTIVRNGDRETVRLAAYVPDEAPVRDAGAVLLSVKGIGATERASEWLADRLAPDGFVVCVQNGLQYQRVLERLGAERTVGAFVDFFADVIAPGVIADGGPGSLRIGELDGRYSRRVDEVVADLQAWGPAQSTMNILGYLWAKLGFSAMLAATALADEEMAVLIDEHRGVMAALAREVFRVAATQQVSLEAFDEFDPMGILGPPVEQRAAIERLVRWLNTQSKTRSGVWRDIAVHGRATEATGRYREVIELARSAGFACPHLEMLVELLSECERGVRPMAESNLALLSRRAAVR